jgi:hypothetical protein
VPGQDDSRKNKKFLEIKKSIYIQHINVLA